jgi:hypothetical protein
MKVNFEFLYSANIEEGGICYRLYPHSLFDEKINDNVNSEMARQPLLVSLMTQDISFYNGKIKQQVLKILN